MLSYIDIFPGHTYSYTRIRHWKNYAASRILCSTSTLFITIWISYDFRIPSRVFSTDAGKPQDHFDSIDGVEVRVVPQEQDSKWLHSFGTFDGGGELMHTAWQKMNHVFAIRRSGESCPLPSGPKVVNGCPNFPRALLDQHPVDLLVIERCSQSESLPTGTVYSWETAIGKTKIDNRPQVILESWGTACTTWSRGPVTKECITRWSQMGYETSLKLLRG